MSVKGVGMCLARVDYFRCWRRLAFHSVHYIPPPLGRSTSFTETKVSGDAR